MSALGPLGEVGEHYRLVCLDPMSGLKWDIVVRQSRAATSCHEQSQQGSPYSITLVDARAQRKRHLSSQSWIDDQFVLSRCPGRQIGLLFALEGAFDVAVRADTGRGCQARGTGRP